MTRSLTLARWAVMAELQKLDGLLPAPRSSWLLENRDASGRAVVTRIDKATTGA